MPTEKQALFLLKLGYPADSSTLTIQEAAGIIDRLKLQADYAKQVVLQNADIVQMAEQRVELRKSGKQHAGPCPKCGGDDRFYCTENSFGCRKCHPKPGDAIEYVSWLDNLSYEDALARLGGPMPTAPAFDKVKPTVKPVVQNQEWDEQRQRRIAIDAHLALLRGATKQSQMALAYLQNRCIDMATVKAFSVGYDAKYLPGSYDYASKKQSYPKQVAITLPWFGHDNMLISIKYRFIEKHTYTGIDNKEHTENKSSPKNNREHGNLFGWQALQGPDNRLVLIICEGEINALSLWQVGNHVIDVLSAGPEGQIINLPTAAIELAKQYKHVIVWADDRNIADKAAIQIGASAMESPKSAEYPKGADANDMLRAGALCDWLSFAMGQLGVDVPPMPVPIPTPAPVLTNGNTLIITDAQPLDFNLEFAPDPAPKVAPRRADDLDALTADLRSFVGRVVSNDQMYVLMRRSNRGPVKVWGEWYNSTTWPCDHLILGWWEAVNA